VKAILKEAPELAHDELVALVEALWAKPVFERRLAAGMLMEARVDLLTPDDLGLLRRLIGESLTWALVDVLAGDVAGGVLLAHPETATCLDAWAVDPDFWVRRSALLAQLEPLKAGAPFECFAGYADAMLDEKEFFVRKAIGWVLRETGKRRPQEVFEWLAPRTQRASGVTMREAVKYLPARQAEALMTAYREKRPAA
jgi:3-methyladenine DNA glycosylase AlkD